MSNEAMTVADWLRASMAWLDDKSMRSTVLEKMEEAAEILSTLPIAVEGKVKALEWGPHPIFGGDDLAVAIIMQWGEHGHKYQAGRDADGPGYKAFLAPTHGSWFWTSPGHASLEDAKAAAQTDYERRVLSSLISSPGKDGGQEVEAVEWQGRYWIEEENRWSNWITNPVGYPWAHEPQEGRSEIRYLYPQPASTALVEAMRPHIEKLRGCVAINEAMGRVVEGQADATRALIAAFDALSASTSREGESE